MITGFWKGKIDRKKVELKIIQNGDSLTGTSYYYESAHNFRRYTIKGYFDAATNSVVWWDDQLVSSKLLAPGRVPLQSVADFNCPGGGRMYLDGTAAAKRNTDNVKGTVSLTKVQDPTFLDEWDYVIDNYTTGANDPYIIDSVGLIAKNTIKFPEVVVESVETKNAPVVINDAPAHTTLPPVSTETMVLKSQTIEEKFTIRKKVYTAEIPLKGDFIELRFYDNVQVDGDSITLFLNQKLVFTHIRLTEKPFVWRIPITDLKDENEISMVAENLGLVPPNTAYMVAMVDGRQYDVNLSSTEETSATIRLKKPKREE